MTFSATERLAIIARVRYELGYSAVTIAGEPYFSIAFAPEVAIDALYSGASTTSGTAITATTPTIITLASGTGFATGARVHVDVGAQREVVVAQYVTGASLTARFTKQHSGTYVVEAESGESMLRTILGRLDDIADKLASSLGTAGIKKADEVEFFDRRTTLDALEEQRSHWRMELGLLLKLPVMPQGGSGGGGRMELY